MDWIKDRLKERTSFDGIAMIGMGVVFLLFNGLAEWAAYAAIAYGAWTLFKGE
jgi:hypothetical protein